MFQWILRSCWTTCCWLAVIQSPRVMAGVPSALARCDRSAASRSQRNVAVPPGSEQRGNWRQLASDFSRLSRPDPGAWQLAGARVRTAARLAAPRLPGKGVVSAHGPAAGRLGGEADLAAPGWNEQHGRRLRQRRQRGNRRQLHHALRIRRDGPQPSGRGEHDRLLCRQHAVRPRWACSISSDVGEASIGGLSGGPIRSGDRRPLRHPRT